MKANTPIILTTFNKTTTKEDTPKILSPQPCLVYLLTENTPYIKDILYPIK